MLQLRMALVTLMWWGAYEANRWIFSWAGWSESAALIYTICCIGGQATVALSNSKRDVES